MNDDNIVKIMQSLGLDYGPAIESTLAFEKRISSLNKQLAEMKMLALQGAKDINNAISSQLGQMAGNKTIVDQFGTPLKTVQTQIDNMAKAATSGFTTATTAAKTHGNTIQDVAKKYNILGSEFQRRTSWFLTGTLFYGAMNAAKEAIQTISEVEMSMVEIARVMEDSRFVFEEYRNELLQLGIDYGQSFETVQDIALRWAQAGYNVKDSLELTKTALLALNTAELNTQNATESMIGIMAQWGLQAEDLSLLIDKINKTADDFTVTSQDLVDGLLRSSSAAKIMNLSIDETIALLTVMREASGRTGREVGNALNSILSYIQRPASVNMLESLGIGVFADEARTQFRSVMEIFKDIEARWKTSSDALKDGFVQAADDAGLFSEELATALGMQEQWNDLQQRDIAQASAGVYRRNYFIGLIERLSSAQEVLNGLTDAAGYSQAENARTMDTLEKKYQSLKTAAQELAVALGDAGLLDALKGIVDFGTDAAHTIANLSDEGKALLTTSLELLAVIGSIKGIKGLFTDRSIIFGATAVLPSWAKLPAIILAVVSALALYKNNLDSATSSIDDFNSRQDKLNQNYESQIKAAEESKESMLAEAKSAETLANMLEELTRKEELNNSEKAQMKSIVQQLNDIFPSLNLQIDAQTGKIIGNTQAIYDNIEALKQRAIVQGYEAKMTATASAYVEQESLVGDTRNTLEKEISELNSLKIQYQGALREIERTREKAKEKGWSAGVLGREIAAINKKYGITNIEGQIKERERSINDLRKLVNEQEKTLNELDAELNDWADKAVGSTPQLTDTEPYIPSYTPSSSGSKTSSSRTKAYSNPALDNALKVLDYKKHLNQISLQDEIEYLKNVKSQYVKTTDELMDINKRLYDAEQALMDATFQRSINWINERKDLGELSIEEEIEAWERVKNNQLNNAEAVKEATINLYKLRKQLMTESYNKELSNIQHLTRIGVYSVQEQINAYSSLYEFKANSVEEEQKRIENLFELYKSLISDQQRTIKIAHDERIKQIDEEARKKKEMYDAEIEAIEKELDLLNRQEQEYDHENRMADLKEQLAYWQVRTSEDARKKVAEILKQIDEEEHRREIELKKQGLEDKKRVLEDEVKSIDETARLERERWEKSYKEIEIAFDEHSIDMIALASTMSKGMFEEFQNNYLIPLEDALRNADYGSIGGILEGIDDFADKAYDKTFNSNNAQIYRLASSILELKRQYEYGGNKDAHQKALPLYSQLEKLNQTVANTLRSMYYKEAKEYIASLPKAHTGAEVLTYGAAYLKPGELIFPPDLSVKLDGLLDFLNRNPVYQSSSSSYAYDNRKEINIDKLLNIEKNYMEDEVDAEILLRELRRQISSVR